KAFLVQGSPLLRWRVTLNIQYLPLCLFPGGRYPKVGGDRRKRTVFTPAQIELLKKEFEENQYPGYQTREALARCIGVEEDRVHVRIGMVGAPKIWFQNRRCKLRHRTLPSDLPLCLFPGGSHPKVGGDRRKRTVFTPAQIELLKKSFEENQYPGYQTREALARCIGIEEDRVHVSIGMVGAPKTSLNRTYLEPFETLRISLA
uniref:Homeobox domain-containing protein n=1 Tax=Podarcis muralis TaxID=64176 RepID=A0A670HYC0_PODMU